jgi:hypothetical protein
MLRTIRSALVDVYRDGFRLFRVAPLIPLLAIVPEAAQHAAEVAIGMFNSPESARALGSDPVRWAFGYVKVAGLIIAFLAAARFRVVGSRWWDLRTVRWPAFVAALALNLALAVALEGLKRVAPAASFQLLSAVVTVATLPLLVYLFNPLIGERLTLRDAFTSGWLAIPLLILLLIAAYVPAFVVHAGLNRLAIGQPLPLLALMLLVDSIVVGVLAALVGTALARGSKLQPKELVAST